MRKVITILLVILLKIASVHAEENNVNSQNGESLGSQEKEEIVVGIYDNLPLVGVDENGRPDGMFVDLMNYVADKDNLQVKYVHGTLSECFERVETGQVDLVLGIAYTEERAQKYIYNDLTLYTNWAQIYSNNNLKIESYTDLHNTMIGVESSDVHYVGKGGIRNVLEAFDVDVEYIEFPSRVEMLDALNKGYIDAGVVSRLYGEYYDDNYNISLTPIQFNPIKLKIIAGHEGNQKYLVMFDKHLDKLMQDESSLYYKSIDNLFGSKKFYIPPTMKFMIYILIAMLFASLITIIFARQLIRKQHKSILNQNNHLRHVLKCISSFSGIDNMDALFEKFVDHMKAIIKTDNLEIVSIIHYDDDYYIDESPYVTSQYKAEATYKLNRSSIDARVLSTILVMNEQNEDIFFDDHYIIARYDSSHKVDGFVYVKTDKVIKEREIVSIYLINLLSALQTIIANNARTDEKTKLLISLGELIEKRDKFVANHVRRVSDATTFLAKKFGYNDKALYQVTIASSVHDIGKVFVPDSVLNKPGKLSTEEFQAIKEHATDKFEFMADDDDKLARTVHNVIRYHHENWDGSGYPEGLLEDKIPLEARLTSIIDVFEALTHKRSYKEKWPYEKAVEFIKDNAGKKFDPEIVEVFEKHSLEIYEIFKQSPDADDEVQIG